MASAFNYFNSFTEALCEKKHDLGADSFKICLSNTAIVGTETQLSGLTPISYTNVVTTPNASLVVGTNSTATQSGGIYKLTLADMTITATGGAVATFRYVVLYNDTATNDELIGWWDYGVGGVTLATGETFVIDFDGTNGVVAIAHA